MRRPGGEPVAERNPWWCTSRVHRMQSGRIRKAAETVSTVFAGAREEEARSLDVSISRTMAQTIARTIGRTIRQSRGPLSLSVFWRQDAATRAHTYHQQRD